MNPCATPGGGGIGMPIAEIAVAASTPIATPTKPPRTPSAARRSGEPHSSHPRRASVSSNRAGAAACHSCITADNVHGMCRNIKTLHNFEPPATDDEIRAAALQYVRKISGSTKPSRANEEAFARAVDEVTASSMRLLGSLVTAAPPRNREVEAERARERARKRFPAAAA